MAVAALAAGFWLSSFDSRPVLIENKLSSVLRPLFRQSTTTVIFVGDIMLARNVEILIDKNGRDYPFYKIKTALQADIVAGNFEGAISEKHVLTPAGSFSLSVKEDVAKVLSENGFNFLSLANNHAGDFGQSSLLNMEKMLTSFGSKPFGRPFDLGGPATTTKNGLDLAFFGFDFTWPRLNIAAATSTITQFRQDHPLSFIAVYAHWGSEYKPADDFEQMAGRALIDSGADVVIGGHPHVVQKIEVYKNKPIFYSLGNFIFDQYFSKDVQTGLMVRLKLSPSNSEYELLPIKSQKSQPELMTSSEAAGFLQKLASSSDSAWRNEIIAGKLEFSR